MRKFRCVLAAFAAFAALAVPSAASAHDPILFVHGWSGGTGNWTYEIGKFKADGWASNELYNWSYDWTKPNTQIAQDVANKVDAILAATGKSKVDLVTHSMGGLSTRYYLKALGGQAKVDDWVSIGGPNHGTNLSYVCAPFTVSCNDMKYGSSLINYLNSGDETPGAVHSGTFWSSCDEVINPDTSVLLSGATNTWVGCWGHISMLGSSYVYGKVRDFVR